MARQPQVVTAVIHPCNSPVPKKTKRPGPAKHAKFTSSESSKQHQVALQPNSSVSLKSNFARPTTSTLLKSRCPSKPASKGRTSKTTEVKPLDCVPKKKEHINSAANASAPLTTRKPRKHQLPAAGRGVKGSSSERSQRSGTAASSTTGSRRQRSSPASSSSERPRKSASLSSRPPQTSSAGRKSSRFSAASTQTRYPGVTSASSGAGQRRSPSPSATSGRSQSPGTAPSRAVRSASHEARLNQISSQIDQLRRTSPRIASPEFTSTRTNLVAGSRSPSPVQSAIQPPTADSSPWQLTANSAALFASRPDSRSRSQSQSQSQSDSRSRSRSPGAAAIRTGTTTWVETRNRAAALGSAEETAASGSPPPVWQTRRHLPRVCYPRPSPARTPRARSSSSQTRRTTLGGGRVTLASRGGRRRSPSVRGSPRRPARTPASLRRPARAPVTSREPTRVPASARRTGGTPVDRVVEPATIDYSPQSSYMAGLLKRGAVRRPVGKENLRSSVAVDRQGHRRREVGRTPSVTSQRSTASEPAKSPPKPARSILRTSASSNHAAVDPGPRHYGYDWVSDMLDLSAPLPRPREEIQAAKRFRDRNWDATHGRAEGRSVPGDPRSDGPRPEKHKCVHEYYINSRLFPTPLYTDGEGRSLCPVCRAVGPSPASRRSRSLSPGSRKEGRSRSRSPAGDREGRSRQRSGASVRGRASPARRRSSVSWQDEVALASPVPSKTGTSRPTRGRISRSRSPSGPVSVTCPNCRHRLSLSAAELSDAFSDSLEPRRGRRAAPTPAPSPPPRLEPETARCPGEEGEARVTRRQSPAAANKRRRSPVTLRSRTESCRQPVKAMFTVPTSLFHDAREGCDVTTGGGRADWDGSEADLSHPPGPVSHPLWPRQLDLSPTRLRPIARGWPRQETRGNLGRPSDPLRRAATGLLQSGRNPAPRRSVQNSGGSGAKNTYSLRRCIGERI